MWFIAHRGLVKNDIKENTIEAFEAAIKSDKYVGFELDVRVTKDNVFVIYHDMLFKGRLVNKVLYKELKKEHIPKLIDVLKLNTNKIIMIEIKDFSIDVIKLSKILNKFNTKKLYISSFNNKILLELKPYLRNIKIGSLNYVLNSLDNYSSYDFICIINYLITPKIIEYFKANNIELFSYGISNKNNIKYKNIFYIIDENN